MSERDDNSPSTAVVAGLVAGGILLVAMLLTFFGALMEIRHPAVVVGPESATSCANCGNACADCRCPGGCQCKPATVAEPAEPASAGHTKCGCGDDGSPCDCAGGPESCPCTKIPISHLPPNEHPDPLPELPQAAPPESPSEPTTHPQPSSSPAVAAQPVAVEIVFFTASWCGPCQMVKPIVASYKTAGWNVRTVDCSNGTPAEYGQRGCNGLPTLIVLKGGKETKRFNGAPVDPNELAKAVTQ